MRGALLILGAWTVYGLVHAVYWMATNQTQLWRWGWIVATALILAWVWAALTPLVFRLSTAAAPARVGWTASIAIHGAVLATISLVMTALRLALIAVLLTDVTPPLASRFEYVPKIFAEVFWSRAVFWADVHLFTYLTVVLTGLALASHRRYVDRALRAHVLETQLARAQLHFLELQLQPHFLFNSLNAIQELAHETPNAAERMLRRLHALLAMSLERSGRDEVSLAEELAALEPYLDIQRTRFEWLSVKVSADEAARLALVPHLILQPLAENAIRHGLAVRQAPGHIDVSAERRGDRLLLRVRDDGVGLSPLKSGRPGIGLRNAGERLRQLYGADHRFELRQAPGSGVLVEIEIPYRAAASPVARSSWTDHTGSRERLVEVPMEEIAAWRTGEFAASMEGPSGLALDEPPPPVRSSAARTAADESELHSRSTSDASVPPPANPPERADPELPLLTRRTWFTLVAVWLVAFVLWTSQMHLFVFLSEPDMARWDAEIARLQLAGAAYWIAVSLGVLLLARRFRLTRRRLVPHLAIHLVAAVAASFAFLWVLQALRLNPGPILANTLNINPLTGNFFVYFGLLAWSHSRDFAAWYAAREITAAQLTSRIARSRFQALCVQVRPQFLLGTLDLLARLVHVDVPRADRLIARLADVLRLTLEMAREHVTTLQQELQLLTTSVEAHRLGIRPSVTLETHVDPAALPTPMPSRLLCTMVDDLLAAEPDGAGATGAVLPLTVQITAERGRDATRVRLHGDAPWKVESPDLHAWWRKKSAAEAAVADADPLVTVAFPDRTTAVLIIADDPPPSEPNAAHATPVAA